MDAAGTRIFYVAWSVWIAVVLATGWSSAPVQAQENNAFEEAEASWQSDAADLEYRVLRHERVRGDAHTGQGSELIQINAGAGSHVYFRHAITPAYIIPELVPSLWVKADRPGVQLMARVVLPHTIDPRSGAPAATLIRGESYSRVGQWQTLRILDTPQLLTRQLRILRSQLGPQVDEREAYVDALVLNVYGGPGQTSVLVDDLAVAGVVPHQRSGPAPTTSAGGGEQDASLKAASVRRVALDGSILSVDGRPWFPRMIQWRGESLAWLKEHGFNTVRSSGPVSPQTLAEARRLGMWLVAPPPAEVLERNGSIPAGYEAVLAWHMGSGLAGPELQQVAKAARQLRMADRAFSRPLVCHAEEDLKSYSRHVNLLSVYRLPLGTSLELQDYGAWLRQQSQLALPGTPIWGVVQTEPAESLRIQAAELAGGSLTGPTVDADAIRLLTYQTLLSGVRGVEFASTSRLDAGDLPTRIRAISLALLNLELELIEPWLSAGAFAAPATSKKANVRAAVLQVDRARLVVGVRCAKGAQIAPEAQEQAEALLVPGIPDGAHRAYELTPAGLRPLRNTRIAGGTSIQVEDFPITTLAVLTADPILTSKIQKRVEEMAPRAAHLQRALAAAVLAQTEQLAARLSGVPDLPPSATVLSSARAALARSEQRLAVRDFGGAFLAARNAMTPLAQWKREAWLRATADLPSTTTSPLAVSYSTQAEHLMFMAPLATSLPGANMLAGGGFEDLESMLSAGWRHFEHPQPGVETSVELSPLAPYAERFSLRLQARPSDPAMPPVVLESPPLWITSAPVWVESGDVVCIRGQVRTSGKITGSVDGLMVIDSLGGEALAARIDATGGWKEFALYRAAPRSGDMTVTLALTGLGDVWIDDVSVRLVRSLRPRREGGGDIDTARLPTAPTWNGRAAELPEVPRPLFDAPRLR